MALALLKKIKNYTMKQLLIIVSVIALFSCSSADNDAQTDSVAIITQDTTTVATEALITEGDTLCYQFVSGKDVYTYRLFIKDSAVSGTAHYDNFEKDDSKGSVNGKLTNDILHLWYSFESEGMQSVSERYFKVASGQITEGIGKIDVKGDTAYFPSPETIDYTKGLVFKQTACK